jgi:D-amino-acid dehydrogenase
MGNQKDILIIGGGVIGICTAYYLAEQGRSVELIEKQDICAGSSYGNAGLVSSSHAIPLAAPGVLSKGLRWMLNPEGPFYIKPRPDLELIRWLWRFRGACRREPMLRTISVLLELLKAGGHLHGQLSRDNAIDFGYEHHGRLFLFRSRPELEAEINSAKLLDEFGVKSRILNTDGVRELAPHIQPDVVGGVFFESYAHLVPDRFVRQMARLAEERGAVLHTETEVLGFETDGRRISTVITTRGDFSPDQIVLAAGSWSAPLARELKIRLPIQPAKGYSITVKKTQKMPTQSLMLGEAKVAVTPMGDRLRFTSTLELAGLDFNINRRRVAATRRAVNDYLTGMENVELIEIWRGLRPTTPDTLPLIGRSRKLENLIVATGHGMLGMAHGPVTGLLVSQIVAGAAPALDPAPFRLERFG